MIKKRIAPQIKNGEGAFARPPEHMKHTAKQLCSDSQVADAATVKGAKAAAMFNRFAFAPLYKSNISPVIMDIREELRRGSEGSQERFRELKKKLAAAPALLQRDVETIRAVHGNEPVFGQMAHFASSSLSTLLTYLPKFKPDEKSEEMAQIRQGIVGGCNLLDGLFAFYAAISPKTAGLQIC